MMAKQLTHVDTKSQIPGNLVAGPSVTSNVAGQNGTTNPSAGLMPLSFGRNYHVRDFYCPVMTASCRFHVSIWLGHSRFHG